MLMIEYYGEKSAHSREQIDLEDVNNDYYGKESAGRSRYKQMNSKYIEISQT